MCRSFRVCTILALFLATAPAVFAQYRFEEDSRPSFGTSAASIYSINAFAFEPFDSSDTYTWNGTGSRWATSGTGYLAASVTLPSGALVTALELQGCDTSASGGFTVRLEMNTVNGGSEQVSDLLDTFTGNAPSPGCGFFNSPAGSSIVINNQINSYFVLVQQNVLDSSLRFQAVRLYYKLQMSPAPATATFADVPTSHLYFRAIEALAASGITGGCGGGNFCPNQAVTRGELAKFLANSLGLHWPN